MFDSWAVMALLNNEQPAATVVRELLDEADAGRQLLYMCLLNLGEVYYRLISRRGLEKAQKTKFRLLNAPIRFEPADAGLIWIAAELKGAHALPYADAFAASLALRLDARLATGDPDFKPLESGAGLRVRWLSREGKK